MNRFLVILTVLSVFGHAVMGCCAHADHDPACQAGSIDQFEHDSHESTHSHHHECDNPTAPCNHAPGEEHDCHHANCHWLASSSSLDLSITSPFDNAVLVCDEFSQQVCVNLSRTLFSSNSQSPPRLPMRTHLALSILLI